MSESFKNILIVVCSIVGSVMVVAGYNRLTKKDTEDETRNNAIISTKLDYAIKGIEEIKSDNREQIKQNNDINERMATVESSTKSAHKRIDELEK
ncbi:MAG TPA: hypothetical protein VIK26_02510 [Clostridium sp.]